MWLGYNINYYSEIILNRMINFRQALIGTLKNKKGFKKILVSALRIQQGSRNVPCEKQH